MRPRVRRQALMPKGTYTDWYWPPSPTVSRTIAAGYSSFEHAFVPETDPGPDSTYFWAHQFKLVEGEGGYLGLQTRGDRADGSRGKTAIFSVWGALGAEGPGTVRFTGEGEGWSCRIPYEWQAGRIYRLYLYSSEASWWEASVLDEETEVESWIGAIRVPDGWRGLDAWSVMWTEYYGQPVGDCADLAHSRVVFGTPIADGAVTPQGSNNRIGDQGTCANSRVEGVDGGVLHQMGTG